MLAEEKILVGFTWIYLDLLGFALIYLDLVRVSRGVMEWLFSIGDF
jgi:hypothetical protein